MFEARTPDVNAEGANVFLNERIDLSLTGRDLVDVTIKFFGAMAKMPSDLFTWYFTEALKDDDHRKSSANR